MLIPQTRDVDLGDGWSAIIKRPTHYVYQLWLAMARPKVEGGHLELGRDAPQPLAVPSDADWARFYETTFVPDAVLRYKQPDGTETAGADLYLPDLGMIRFYALISKVIEFTQEANGTFRGAPEGAGPGGGTRDGEAGAAPRPDAERVA